MSSSSTDPDTVKRRLAFQKSYSLEHGQSWKRRSLIEDAKFDSVTNAEFAKRESNTSATETALDDAVKDDDVFTTLPNGDVTSVPETALNRKCSLAFSIRESGGLSRIFKIFENSRATIIQVETRRPKVKGPQLEVFVHFEATRDDVVNCVKTLKQSSAVQDLKVLSEVDTTVTATTWVPTHITDLDRCNHLLTKFDPDLAYDHPGFADKEYRTRRAQIVDIAFHYRHGQCIPKVDYNISEIETWGNVYRNLWKLYPTHACKEHMRIFRLLERECGYSEHNIPQQEDVSNFLKRKTGFQLRPVAGLLSARDFLSSLAFRVFQCTQYIRHGSKPDHTVEPDCVHELLGHVPMLAEPGFAQFSQEIGLASLGASDTDIERFATLYWFTVEFGLCRQGGEVRAYGAGLLSAYGELAYALSDKPEHRRFDPAKTAVQEYDDQDYQEVYFVCDSFDDMKEKVRQFASTIKRPYEVRYDPFTQSIQVMDDADVIQDITRVLKGDLNSLHNAVKRIQTLTTA